MTTPHKIILLYHRVACLSSDPWSLCVSPEHFEEHLQVLRKYKPAKIRELLDVQNSSRSNIDCAVAVTFDDGYADNFEEAAPLLTRYEIPASFFIATGYVDGNREFWWDELERFTFETRSQALAAIFWEDTPDLPPFEMEARRLLYFRLYDDLQAMPHEARSALLREWLEKAELSPGVRPSHRIMTKDQISLLAANGLFEIGSHTRTHPKLSGQGLSDQTKEIVGSRNWLNARLPGPVAGFSYPFGAPHHYDASTVQIVKDAGFSYAVTTAGRPVEATDSRFQLPRFNVTDMNGGEFERYLFQEALQHIPRGI